jgi:hypothetical protein
MRLTSPQTGRSQSGQTMIEVIVALFMLTMTLVAGLSLAIYSNSRNVNNMNQITALNLAREGVEAIRMLRDTNWLAADYDNPNQAENFYELSGGCNYGGVPVLVRPCYPDAFHAPFDIETSSNPDYYRVLFLPLSGQLPNYYLDPRNGQETYLLCVTGNAYTHVNPPTCNHTTAQFARKITVSTGNTTWPYTTELSNPNNAGGHSPEKIITSTVIWKGKTCAEFADNNVNPETLVTPCKVIITERLTNWKDYR